ncbi:MAG: sigma 54-interacting transcriptional regulator [Roseibacillus sp.]|nr:sigma 54-interacting transcriptional regulator [Roseibacillus sp.]
MNLPRVLIVEDEHALALALAAAVRQASVDSDLAPSAAQARKHLDSPANYEAMILDIGLPDQNGLEFLESLPEEKRPPTIVITAHGEIQNTIAARKLGVIDFLPKPLDFDEFQSVLRRVVKPTRRALDAAAPAPETVAFVGAAPSMRPVFQQIAHSCASDDPVLVRGATGTGKSHAARLIQGNSMRSGPTETLAIGPSTTSDELNVTLQRANQGVLILEEVASLNAEGQAELVRQIEAGTEGDFPRLIATTHDDLRELVSAGAFRSDLFYRLQVLEVRLPSLSDRMEDLPALVSYFIGQLVPDRNLAITEATLGRLMAHDWPGNLRELRNSIAFSLTVNSGAAAIEENDLPDYLRSEASSIDEQAPTLLVQALDSWLDAQLEEEEETVYRDLAETLEATLIRRLLVRYDGKLARMASALKANRTTLRRRLQNS